MLVALDQHRLALALRHRHRRDLPGQPPGGRGRGRPLLGAQGEGVLVLADDAVLVGDVLRRSRGIASVPYSRSHRAG